MVKKEATLGFTLLEVMLVVVILAMLAASAVPRLAASAEFARAKVDITTGKEVKTALDRYQIEHGTYPRIGQLQTKNGEVLGLNFVPDYIRKLDNQVTQQAADEDKKGFGIAEFEPGSSFPKPDHLIMIYLTMDGKAAEVKVFDNDLIKELWSSI